MSTVCGDLSTQAGSALGGSLSTQGLPVLPALPNGVEHPAVPLLPALLPPLGLLPLCLLQPALGLGRLLDPLSLQASSHLAGKQVITR